MTSSLVRRLLLVTVMAALVPASTLAQTPTRTQTPTPTPTPTQSPRLIPPGPPTPTIQQRYEQPVPTTAPTPRPEDRDLDFRRFRSFRPIVRIGQNYTLRAGDTSQELVTILGDVRIEGRVTRNLVVVMGSATLTSTAIIERSLVVVGGSAHIEPGAIVEDDLVVIGGTLDAPPDFSTRGEHVVIGSPAVGAALQGLVPWITRGLLIGRVIVPDLGWNWVLVAISFLLGLILNQIFSRQVTACMDVLARRPLSAFLMGLLMMLLAPIILTIVAASVVGLLVVPFAFFAFVLAGMIGKVGVARMIGRSVVRREETDGASRGLGTFVLGSVVLIVAYMLPVLGLLTWATVGVFGFGAATMAFAATLRRERPATPPKDATPVPPAPPTPPAAHREPFPPAPATAASAVENPAELRSSKFEVRSSSHDDLTPYPRATFFDRVAAIALDTVLVGIAVSFFDHDWDDGGSFFVLIMLAYHVAFWTWKGTTLGGIICNVRIARLAGGRASTDVRFTDALIRALSSVFSIVALGIGCFWMLTDRDAQMWHDKIAGTIVVKVPREVVLA